MKLIHGRFYVATVKQGVLSIHIVESEEEAIEIRDNAIDDGQEVSDIQPLIITTS